MSRGPKPKSVEELRLSGSWRAAYRAEIQPQDGEVEPPVYVVASPAAYACWVRVLPLLQVQNAGKPIDVSAFSRYCMLTAEVESFAARSGELSTREINTMLRVGSEMLRIEREFGMTPASRRINLQSSKQKHGNSAESKYFGGSKTA